MNIQVIITVYDVYDITGDRQGGKDLILNPWLKVYSVDTVENEDTKIGVWNPDLNEYSKNQFAPDQYIQILQIIMVFSIFSL